MVALYWQVKALTAEFGRGFSKRNLHYMARFAEVYPDAKIVHALRSQFRPGATLLCTRLADRLGDAARLPRSVDGQRYFFFLRTSGACWFHQTN